jgi:CRISPR-associated protein Csb2
MFGIVVDLLAGRYAATAYNDRDLVEWPPHPARLFSGLVASWGEEDPHAGSGREERAALEWLEQQPAPDILADGFASTGARSVVTFFVPVNDASQVGEVDRSKLDEAERALANATGEKEVTRARKSADKLRAKLAADTARLIAPPARFGKDPRAGLEALPDHRGRQPRTFPVATPATPRIAFVWPHVVIPYDVSSALQRLLSRLVRIGHSSSLVRAALASEIEVQTLAGRVCRFRPDERDGELVIRWIGPGQLVRLCQAYDRHRESEPRVLPAQFVRYTVRQEAAAAVPAESLFADDFVTFARVLGPRLPMTSTVGIARQFRRALMSHADNPVHEVISGHRPDGSPSERPHAAIVPLPYVLGRHADGSLIGIAVVLPRDAGQEARRAILRAIGSYERSYRVDAADDIPSVQLALGDTGDLWLRRVAWSDDRVTLDPRTWTRRSRRWATATPIALDRNPGNLHDADPVRRRAAFDEARATVIEAVSRIGLPVPTEVDVVRSCVLPGSTKPRAFPRFPFDRSRTQRVLVHARLVFEKPVRGPVLIGAGRYHGLGLCLPVDHSQDRTP